MVWALATAGHASSTLFDATAVAAKASFKDFKSQELANTVWAYAIVDATAEIQRLKDFNPQEL
eukprot:6239428-Karenia_brevis.AAC.1